MNDQLAFLGTFAAPGLDRRLGWSHVPLVVSLVDGTIAIGFLIVFLTSARTHLAGYGDYRNRVRYRLAPIVW